MDNNDTSFKFDATSFKEYVKDAREMIRHEDGLINHRMTWLNTIQGFLFAGLGFSWQNSGNSLLVCVFCFVGSLSAYSAFRSLRAATKAIDKVKNNYKELCESHDEMKALSQKYPDVIGWEGQKGNRGIHSWLNPWRFLPSMFIVSWVLTLVLFVYTQVN